MATAGISDENPVDASGTFRVLLDGVEVAAGQLQFGLAVPVQADVSDGLRLRLEVNIPSAAHSCAVPNATPVLAIWGDAALS